MQYVDLTHILSTATPVYPEDAPIDLRQIAFLEQHGFADHHLAISMHVGTHMDGPRHMLKDGKLLSEFPVEKFFGKGHLIDARGKTSIDADLLTGRDIGAGDVVLVWTDSDKKYNQQEYFGNFPFLAENFANQLIKLGVKFVGLDTASPDKSPYTIHKLLLGKEVLIIENLTNLEKLEGKEFEVVALPAKFETDSAPCRVVAKIL